MAVGELVEVEPDTLPDARVSAIDDLLAQLGRAGGPAGIERVGVADGLHVERRLGQPALHVDPGPDQGAVQAIGLHRLADLRDALAELGDGAAGLVNGRHARRGGAAAADVRQGDRDAAHARSFRSARPGQSCGTAVRMSPAAEKPPLSSAEVARAR